MKFKANIAKQLLISMFSAIAVNAYAIVAPKTPIQYTQPDGTVITLQMHGDEFHHWVTSGGRVVQMDADGFYRPCATAASVTPDMLERRRQAAALFGKRRGREAPFRRAGRSSLCFWWNSATSSSPLKAPILCSMTC